MEKVSVMKVVEQIQLATAKSIHKIVTWEEGRVKETGGNIMNELSEKKQRGGAA